MNHITEGEQKVEKGDGFKFNFIPQNKIVLSDLTILLPNKETLLAGVELEFIHAGTIGLKVIRHWQKYFNCVSLQGFGRLVTAIFHYRKIKN